MRFQADPPQLALFGTVRSPVIAAWGAGVDSTAMLIELIRRGERVDHVLFADTGAEKPQTYAYLDIFRPWLEARGVPSTVVRYQPQNFKNFPAYRTLDENVLANGTLPGISFGRGTCSQKWKVAPQEKWEKTFAPAVAAWAGGGRVIKLIGYDCSPADQRRWKARDGVHEDERYVYRYPLREWGWTRADCILAIEREGLPVPVKSACYMCAASKPDELASLPVPLLRRIVLMEARAEPRLRNVEGLWRATVKGCRGATPRPGSMTVFIRERGLLPAHEIDEIRAAAPAMLTPFQDSTGSVSVENRPELGSWLRLFDLRDESRFDIGEARLFSSTETPAMRESFTPPANSIPQGSHFRPVQSRPTVP